MTKYTVADLVKGGVFYKVINSRPQKCHIVELIERDMIVFKWYSKYKQRWIYEVDSSYMIHRMHNLNRAVKLI